MDKDSKKQTLSENVNVNMNPSETPILYTDTVFMNTNEDGIVLDVCQKIGTSNQIHVVSRIGMSRTHAKKFIKKLSELLILTEGKTKTKKRN